MDHWSGELRAARDLEDWLEDQLDQALAFLDLPILARMYGAA